jgi:molybdate transport system substrate-binding protein
MTTIKVMSTGAVEPMVEALGHEFERKTGHRLALTFMTAGAVREAFLGGQIPDLLVAPDSAMRLFEEERRLLAGTRQPLASSITGVAIRKGAPVPDIKTVEAFKRALIAAKAVSYTDPKAGGTSGKIFAELLQRLGIADEVNRNAVFGSRGADVARAVAESRAELGTTFISEMLPFKDLHVIGPLPGELANTNTYTAGIPVRAAQPDLGRALLAALTDPGTRARWSAAGLDPAF